MDRNVFLTLTVRNVLMSLSARRAWIEIHTGTYHPHLHVSLSARRAWIEIAMTSQISVSTVSLSARRAWIEIIDYVIDYANDAVALRKESVDRNPGTNTILSTTAVALRKESVDRNTSPHSINCMTHSRSPQGERG